MEIDNLTIEIGPFSATHCTTVLQINRLFFVDRISYGDHSIKWNSPIYWKGDEKAIWFEPPEEEGAPIRLNAILYDQNFEIIGKFNNNVWEGLDTNYDIITISRAGSLSLVVKSNLNEKVFDLEIFPENKVLISKFISHYPGKKIEIGSAPKYGYLKINDRETFRGKDISVHMSNTALSI